MDTQRPCTTETPAYKHTTMETHRDQGTGLKREQQIKVNQSDHTPPHVHTQMKGKLLTNQIAAVT